MAAMDTHELSKGWSFKKADTDDWLSVNRVPTNVHLDLMDHKKIEDPFLGFNELDCEWVDHNDWIYRVSLPSISSSSKDVKHVLAFDGLDTYATVRLNGEVILESDNMFIMHRVDVTKRLRSDDDNVLEIYFKAALQEAQRVKAAHPEHIWVGFNADMARLAVRKAQYHFGWDWGPVLITCGPWRGVRLETYQARVEDVRIDYGVHSNFKKVSGLITATIEGAAGKAVKFSAKLADNDVFKGTSYVTADSKATIEFHINDPKLWCPHGYGEQTLYDLTVTVTDGHHDLHSVTKRTGFRHGELVQEPDEFGKSFYFRINGIDVFCGGSDWIPADSFTPRISEAKYRQWLEMMVDGYQVMIRVWGGGIWEEDVFYDLCDELGVLVWQDFMFGCGNYPTFPAMLESIERECVGQTKRLRHHPSLVVYAGNNEDYQVAESYGLTYDYEDKDPQSWLKTDFPARYIYEKLLPDIIALHSPQIPYHPGSPWGDGQPTSNPTIGDLHQWNVWHGTQEKYQLYPRLGGRFNSEFGLESFPHIDTIRHFVTDEKEMYPQSRMIDFHNKADGHERRIATYLVENFRVETEVEKYVHLTQVSQAEALMFGYRGWRRQWGAKEGRKCGGALVWQLNDCWPVISWAIVDFFLRKKPAYYAMRRVLAPVAVAVERAFHDWSVVHARPAKSSTWECWAVSSKTTDVRVTVEVRFISIATGKDIKPPLTQHNVCIRANSTTEIWQGTIDNVNEEPHVLAARLWLDHDGELVARDCDWPQPLKYLDFPDRGVRVDSSRHDRLVVTAEKPTKGLVFEEREGILVEDSAMDVVPGDEQVVRVRGLEEGGRRLGWRYLGAP